jgi:microcystin-dependent protein
VTGSKISALNSATSIASNDLLAIVNLVANETQKVTAQVLGKALVQLGISVGPTQPTSPYEGQPWMDTSVSPPVLRAYNGAGWSVLSVGATSVVTSPGGTAPAAPGLGTLWQDTGQTPDELKMWDGAGWVRVDPQGITQTAADARYLQPATAASTYMPLSGGTFTGAVTLAGAPSTNLQPATKLYVDTAVSGIVTVAVPPGTVIWTARNSAPTGYLKANGAAISRSTYADLFAAIGTTFGSGNGSTTFNLPDLRGEFVRGWDDGRGADSGRAFGSSQADEYKSHTHGVTDPGHIHSGSAGRVTPGISVAFSGNGIGDRNITATTGISIGNSGGTETRPRNVALLACIKT